MLQVSGKNMLYKWVHIIGFSNTNHLTKYEIFQKFGFVPPHISYKERLEIINGMINPWSYYKEKYDPGGIRTPDLQLRRLQR